MPPLWKWMRAGKVSVKCPPSMWDVASKNPLSKIHHRSQHWNCVSLISYKSNILITAGITERDWYLTPFSRRAHSSHGKFPKIQPWVPVFIMTMKSHFQITDCLFWNICNQMKVVQGWKGAKKVIQEGGFEVSLPPIATFKQRSRHPNVIEKSGNNLDQS